MNWPTNDAEQKTGNPILLTRVDAATVPLFHGRVQLFTGSVVEDEKERLIKAYAEGVLTLDDIAQTKVELDKEITILTEAIAALRLELNPKILSAQDIESIKEWTNRIQIGADVLLKSHPEKVREILDLLQTHVTLESKSDKIWAIVSCVFGEKALVSDVSHPWSS